MYRTRCDFNFNTNLSTQPIMFYKLSNPMLLINCNTRGNFVVVHGYRGVTYVGKHPSLPQAPCPTYPFSFSQNQ